MKKLITIVTPCYNEAGNVEELVTRIRSVMQGFVEYDYEHLLIDNASDDDTVTILRRLTAADPHVRVIVNSRNFGHLRSPIHAIFQARGDAVIGMASDLQDPPEMIPEFLRQWEAGFKVVIGVKPKSRETATMFLLRRAYYLTIGRISDVPLIENFTGFGLYDREVIATIRTLDDPYPYFRGLIAELGYPRAEIPFEQPRRVRGVTKNNFYSLFDIAMLGLTSHSKVPIRLATIAGFTLSALSMLLAVGYLVAKLIYWDSFALGMAPVLIGMFFFASVQLFFIGIIGEYIASIHTHVKKRPLVIEKERINFGDADASAQRDGDEAR
ncbi:MAG: glycosyltransferase family 2 protein [Betaproteobacteria bacterium]|nr:glycosyltransferase family 2 protein [Betaproteobacteria bacterium]